MRKNVLKKSAVAALAVILCVLSVFVCSAADNSYVISEINDMKISLPDNITTVTRSSKADDKYFSVFGLDYDTTMKVKLDSENDTIKVRVNDLNEFKKANSFSIDLTNIGSINAKIKNIRILNIQSNVELQDVNIDISTAKDDIINGGETIKLIICIKYNGKKIIENPYYFFDIKYDFDEVVL